MLRFKKTVPLFSGGIFTLFRDDGDKVDPKIRTAKAFEVEREKIQETGWDRLKLMLKLDEHSQISSELNSIYQAGFLGFFIGAVYGGVINSRAAYLNFMENNQATAFKSHLDAKKKLQDEVTVNFAKGAVRWGWRLGLFATSYVGIITCISVYREKSSVFEYIAAGGITGSLFKINLGLRGTVVGGVLGAVLGGVAGAFSIGIMRLTGSSMEEVRYWQYKWKQTRDTQVREAFKKQEKSEPELMKVHDEKVGNEISLENVK